MVYVLILGMEILVEVVATMEAVAEIMVVVAAQIHALEVGWGRMVANILNEHVIIHKVQFGMEQIVHAPLDKMTLEGIVENLLNGTAYHPEVLHGVIGKTDVYVRVST
jgi:hypothetical protein